MKITSSGATNRAVEYDRNSLHVGGASVLLLDTVPNVLTTRFSYTVPTGRKARCSGAKAQIVRTSVAPGVAKAQIQILAASSFQALYTSLVNNTAGAIADASSGGTFYLAAGQQVSGSQGDVNTGGTCDFHLAVAIVEFDA